MTKKQKLSHNGLTPTCSKPHSSATATTLPRNERAEAFTLAEVLITLGVIGVVATLTLPTLINEHRISQWETALKRDYTVLSQGFRKIMADYGCDTIECTGIFSGNLDEEGNVIPDENKINNAMRSAFHVAKSYKKGEGEYMDITYLKGAKSNKTSVTYSNQTYRMVLNDGAIIRFSMNTNGGCIEFGDTKKCAFLTIDINGIIPPNTFGKDVFALGSLLNDGRLLPDTAQKWEEYTGLSSEYWRNNHAQCGTPNRKIKDETIPYINGVNCLARIMENNWRMDYLH